MVIFQEFFARKLTRTGVQVAKMQVQLASNSKKPKKQERPMLPGPNPRFLMDPDLHNASEALD